MARISAAMLALACLFALAQDQPEPLQWSTVYDASKLPGEMGWRVDLGTENSAALAQDGALRIIDASSKTNQRNCYSRSWGARPDRGAVFQATVKVVQCTSAAGVCLLAGDGAHDECLTIYPDRLEMSHCGLTYAMDTTDDYHTYQFRISGMNFEVWADGEMVIDGWGKFTQEAWHGRNVALFGSVSSAALSDSYWKDVRTVTFTRPAQVIQSAKDVVIYRKEGVYACFPSLRRLADGSLYTSFGTRVRRSHIDGTGGSARMISRDGGYAWEPIKDAPEDTRYKREDGTVIVPRARAWVYVDESELPDIKAQNRRWMKVRPGTVAYLGDAMVDITRPDGTKETLKFDTPVPGGCMGFHPDSAFLRKGDLWMLAIYCSTGSEGLSGVWVMRSEDNGERWELVHVAGPVANRLGLGEAALCDNGKGEIVCVMRSGSGGKYNTHQSFSTDGGKTWSPAEDTGIWGYPSNVILLKDGRLLCTYGYRRDAMGVRAVLSADGGHTWDVANEMVISADGHGNGGDNGYPISVQMDDGHIFTIYYINDSENVTQIRGTHWDVPPVE